MTAKKQKKQMGEENDYKIRRLLFCYLIENQKKELILF